MNMALQTNVKIVSTPALVTTPVQYGLLQRKCSPCGSWDKESGEEQKKRLNLQCQSTDGIGQSSIPPLVHEVLGSMGHPLDAEIRAFMEPRFGHDFSKVRVHTDAKAAGSAKAVNALAYTVGRDVVFGARQYAPATSQGQKLLAHELTHVVQQSNAGSLGVQRQTAEEMKHKPAAEAETKLSTTGATSTEAASVPAFSDAEIDALNLASTAKTAARELKKKHSEISFTSGRRNVAEQARAMASNIVSGKDRKWIEKTYSSAASLQKWVDDNPKATKVDEIAKGLEKMMNGMSESNLGKVSKHLSGEAFDVQPQEKDADIIKKDMNALSGLSKFLEKEGGLVRWHAQFKLQVGTITASDIYEREADQMAEEVLMTPCTVPFQRRDRTRTSKGIQGDYPRITLQKAEDGGSGVVDSSSKKPEETHIKKICGPDVTGWLIDKMDTNAKSDVVKEMRESNKNAWFGKHSVWALGKWASLVKTGAEWDYKTKLGKDISGMAPCRQNCSGKLWSVTLDGQCMTYEVVANIHFGYVGRHAGFTEDMLLSGAGEAQVSEGRGEKTDDPRDVQAIKKGFDLFNAGGPGGLNKAGLEKNYYENLPEGDGDKDGCEQCPTKL